MGFMKTIRYSKRARKQLQHLPKAARARVVAVIGELAAPKRALDIKKLRHHIYAYRLRVGRYRVFFNETWVVIFIEEVKIRDERTY